MGRSVKIRSPHIAGARVHSPQARYTAVPKISIKIPPQARLSYRYGLPRTQPKITPGTFGTTPTQGLVGQARLLGQPEDLLPGPHLSKSVLGITAAVGALSVLLAKPEILSWMTNENGSYGNLLGFALLPVLGMVMGGKKDPSTLPFSTSTLKKISYTMGGLFQKSLAPVGFGIAGYCGYAAIDSVVHFDGVMDAVDFGIAVGMGYYAGKKALVYGGAAIGVHHFKKTASKALIPPVEIIIEDTRGLQNLLLKTTLSGDYEWGTVLKVHRKGGQAIVNHIMLPEKAKADGLVGKASKTSLEIDPRKLIKEGYGGHQHFHPSSGTLLSAAHYSITAVDRLGDPSLINFLTFKMPDGPEIVGYNLYSLFLPTNKEKTHFVKSGIKDVFAYLDRKPPI